MRKIIDIASLKSKLIISTIIFIAIFILISFGVIYATNINKGELNGDGEINYADVGLLEQHLINLKELPEDKIKNADMNNDGEITITDLTLLIKKIENTLDYEVEMRNIKVSNYYPKKNEEIKLSFDIAVSYGENVKTITVNGREYEIVKSQTDENLYEITINVGETSGIKEYKFEKVTLENEREVEVDYLVKIDVLKQEPTIANWTVTEDIQKSELNISFDILDLDSAFISGTYKILEKQEETENVEENLDYIKTGTVVSGNNNINVKVEEGKNYKIELCIEHDLDTNSLEQEGDNKGFSIEEKNLSLIVDYGFQLSNIKTYRHGEQADEQTEQFYIGEHIVLKFNSTNNTPCVPEKVVVNGKQCELIAEDNIYTAILDGFDTTGTNKIKI